MIDSLYLASRKGNRFGSFPELDLTALNLAEAAGWIQRIPYGRIRKYVARRFAEIKTLAGEYTRGRIDGPP